MIIEDFVSFELAKLLKEKGFNQLCYTHYSHDGQNVYYNYQTPYDGINMPTLQMAMKWLREVHNLYVDIILHSVNRTLIYEARIDKINSPSDIDVILPQINEPIYENACEAAIKYCLENLV